MKKTMMLAVLSLATVAMAGGRGGPGGEGRGREFFEQRAQQAHLHAVVAISEALGLNEGEALKLSEKLKGFEERRRPLRLSMFESMKAVKDAADGDSAALAQIDAHVQKVLDGRTQLAALDKELYATLSAGLTPQKKAKLALALGQLAREGHGGFKKGHKRGALQRTAQ